MKLVISPAKSLDFERILPTNAYSQAQFLKKSEHLNKLLKKQSAKSLSQLMHISESLAQLNFERNQMWELPFTPKNARPALYAFNGDVYRGLDAYTIPEEKIEKAQNTIRILSGLYGLLKPLDLIQPYRLEMGTKFKVGTDKNLYEFWKQTITNALNSELKDDELLLNLASNEYFKAIDVKALKVPVVNVVFKNFKGGEYKNIAIYAKQARGLMSRFVIDTNAQTKNDLKHFNYDGYNFSEPMSAENELVFIR